MAVVWLFLYLLTMIPSRNYKIDPSIDEILEILSKVPDTLFRFFFCFKKFQTPNSLGKNPWIVFRSELLAIDHFWVLLLSYIKIKFIDDQRKELQLLMTIGKSYKISFKGGYFWTNVWVKYVLINLNGNLVNPRIMFV